MKTLLESLRGLLVLISLVLATTLLTAAAIFGYFSVFEGLSWSYTAVSIGIWCASVATLVVCAVEAAKQGVYFEIVESAFGWVYLASIPANLFFIVNALFLSGSWMPLAYSFLVGSISKLFAITYRNVAMESTTIKEAWPVEKIHGNEEEWSVEEKK